MQQTSEETFIEATPSSKAARRTYVAVGVGFGLLVAGLPGLFRYAEKDLLAQHRYAEVTAHAAVLLRCTSALLFVVAAGVVLFAVHAARVVAARRWPLPGARVEVDTPIVRGTSAVVRGVVAFVVALSLGVMTIYMGALTWQLADATTMPSTRAP